MSKFCKPMVAYVRVCAWAILTNYTLTLKMFNFDFRVFFAVSGGDKRFFNIPQPFLSTFN